MALQRQSGQSEAVQKLSGQSAMYIDNLANQELYRDNLANQRAIQRKSVKSFYPPQVHPCRTAVTTTALRRVGVCDDGDDPDPGGGRCNYVTTFLSFYGQAVGLHLSPRYATKH